jgi:hypothetical protein
MVTRKYSSYAEIDRDLEILKLEKQIHYQKLVLSIDQTKESLLPSNLVFDLVNYYKSFASNIYMNLLKFAIPYLIKWFKNKKRGD